MNPLAMLVIFAQMYRQARNDLGDYSGTIEKEIEKEVVNFFKDNYLKIAAEIRLLPGTVYITSMNITVPEPTHDEIDLARRYKLDAIKAYKNRTGRSLMESKRIIEQVAGV